MPILIRYVVNHPTIYNRYDWGWKAPYVEDVQMVADAYNGQWGTPFWDEYTDLLCDLMLHG